MPIWSIADSPREDEVELLFVVMTLFSCDVCPARAPSAAPRGSGLAAACWSSDDLSRAQLAYPNSRARVNWAWASPTSGRGTPFHLPRSVGQAALTRASAGASPR